MEILRYRLAQDFRGQPCMIEDAAGAFVAFRDIQPATMFRGVTEFDSF